MVWNVSARTTSPEAIADYDRAISIDPKFADALFKSRQSEAGSRRPGTGAIADYEVVAELDVSLAINNRDVTQAYLNRGYIRSNHMDLDGALADFDKAIQFDPNDADASLQARAALSSSSAMQVLQIADFDKSILNRRSQPSGLCRTRFRVAKRQGEQRRPEGL